MVISMRETPRGLATDRLTTTTLSIVCSCGERFIFYDDNPTGIDDAQAHVRDRHKPPTPLSLRQQLERAERLLR